MSNDYRLAILVPTRNRPEFLSIAVSSIVEQVKDLPVVIVVSDNSADNLSDLNRSICDSCRREGIEIKYIRPSASLSMTEHWDWAVSRLPHLTGASHFTILTDRTVFRLQALAELVEESKGNRDYIITFKGDTILDLVNPIVIGENTWSGLRTDLPVQDLIEAAAHCEFSAALPKGLNSIIPLGLIKALSQGRGRIFPKTLSPDYGLAFEILANADSLRCGIIFYDKPFTVGFGLNVSNGAAFATGNHERQSNFVNLNERDGIKLEFLAPLPSLINSANAIVHEYNSAANRNPNGRLMPLCSECYFGYIFRSLDSLPKPVRDQYSRELMGLGYRTGWQSQMRKSLHHLLSRIKQPAPRHFTSRDDAIRYAMKNYPSRVPSIDSGFRRRHACEDS